MHSDRGGWNASNQAHCIQLLHSCSSQRAQHCFDLLCVSCVQCVLRRNSGLSYWGTLMLQAVQTGFCGSLSTVSTFVTEARCALLLHAVLCCAAMCMLC